MSSLELANNQSMLSSRNMVSAFKKMEQERSTWIKTITKSQSLAEQMNTLVSIDSTAAQMAKQMYVMQNAKEDSVRKMLDTLANIRSGFLGDKSFQQMVNELSRPFATAEQFRKLIDQPVSCSYVQSLNLSIDSSIKNTMKLLAEPSMSSNLLQMMKQYEATNKHWTLPHALIETIAPLKALQECYQQCKTEPLQHLKSAPPIFTIVLFRRHIDYERRAYGNSDFASTRTITT